MNQELIEKILAFMRSSEIAWRLEIRCSGHLER